MTGGWVTASCCLHGVAVRQDEDRIEIADTRRPDEVLTFTVAEWAEFLAGVRAGEFDAEDTSS